MRVNVTDGFLCLHQSDAASTPVYIKGSAIILMQECKGETGSFIILQDGTDGMLVREAVQDIGPAITESYKKAAAR